MQTALGMLRWPPPIFWAATPHELRAAIEGVDPSVPRPPSRGRRHSGGRRAPLSRHEFEALRARFPDK